MRHIIGGIFQLLGGVIQAPRGPDEDPTGGFPHGAWMFPVADDVMGEAFTAANTYVLTGGGQPLAWDNRHRLRRMEAGTW